MSNIRIVVIDDQTLFRECLVSLLGMADDLKVVGSTGNAHDAIDLVAAKHPDVVLMDVRMPGMNGVAAAREILSRFPETRVLMLTTFDDDEYLFKALRAGASGYLLKNADRDYLSLAIHAVFRGDSVLDPMVTGKVVTRAVRDENIEPVLMERLTSREREVLNLMARGFNNTSIAVTLLVSRGTVKNHVSHILAKLAARDRAHAVRVASEWGLLNE